MGQGLLQQGLQPRQLPRRHPAADERQAAAPAQGVGELGVGLGQLQRLLQVGELVAVAHRPGLDFAVQRRELLLVAPDALIEAGTDLLGMIAELARDGQGVEPGGLEQAVELLLLLAHGARHHHVGGLLILEERLHEVAGQAGRLAQALQVGRGQGADVDIEEPLLPLQQAQVQVQVGELVQGPEQLLGALALLLEAVQPLLLFRQLPPQLAQPFVDLLQLLLLHHPGPGEGLLPQQAAAGENLVEPRAGAAVELAVVLARRLGQLLLELVAGLGIEQAVFRQHQGGMGRILAQHLESDPLHGQWPEHGQSP